MTDKPLVCTCITFKGKESREKSPEKSLTIRGGIVLVVIAAAIAALVVRIELVNNRLVAAEKEINKLKVSRVTPNDIVGRSPGFHDLVSPRGRIRKSVKAPPTNTIPIQEIKAFVLNITASRLCRPTQKICVPGPPGKIGPRGLRGRRGRRGHRGSRGPKGLQGIMGPPGKHGKQGMMGRTGMSGHKGQKGERGEPGSRGPTGLKGDPGESISKPRILLSPQSLTARENQPAVVQCTAHGNPKPEVTFKRGNYGKRSPRWKKQVGGQLVISRTMRSDAGEYWCEAKNILGVARTRLRLIVEAPPKLRVHSAARTKTFKGSTVWLPCNATGYPQPILEWTRALLALPHRRAQKLRNGTLRIANVEFSDVGVYTCKAKNKLGAVNAATVLIVQPHPVILEPECTTYTTLSDADRHRTYGQPKEQCDSGLATRWYRITGSAGSKLASSCVPKEHCNADATGWLNGNLPSTVDGIVSRQVCFNWDGNCCNWNVNIRIRNCGSFYVYELKMPPACTLRYCTE